MISKHSKQKKEKQIKYRIFIIYGLWGETLFCVATDSSPTLAH